jgi:hypothetical protein
MIVVVATAEDVTEAGMKTIRAVHDFLKKNYPETRVEWLTPISGKLGTHLGVWWHASLAAKEAYDAKLNADPRWQKIFKDAGPGPLWTQRDDYFKVVD